MAALNVFTLQAAVQFSALGTVCNVQALPAGSTPTTVVLTQIGGDPASFLLVTPTATTTATANAGSTSISLTSGANVAIGQLIVGAGIPQGTILVAGSGTSWTLSQATMAALSGTTVNAFNQITRNTGMAINPFTPPVLAYGANTHIIAISQEVGGRSQINVAVGV